MPDALILQYYIELIWVLNEIISINIEDKKSLSLKLSDQDRLVVFSLKDFIFETYITVLGEVNKTDSFDFKTGMTVKDAIQLSNGFTDFANKSNVKVMNIIAINDEKLTKEITVDFSNDLLLNNIKLNPDDIISVPKISYYQPTKFYSVNGQVSVEKYIQFHQKIILSEMLLGII